jgi:hypothetical protein
MTRPASAPRGTITWMAFLVMTIVVVGLTGLFASYALEIPVERVALRDAALDLVLTGADPKSLADSLGDSAPALTGDKAGLPARVAAERTRMHAEIAAEAAAVARRVRWLVVIVTVLGAVFACVIAGIMVPKETVREPAGKL